MAGWDTTCCGPQKGGVWWDKAHTQKATASNAGAALAGARLYERTANPSYLGFSQQVYSYWFSNMVSQGVCDHITTDGTKVWWRFSYNEGLMTGAALALARVTGSSTYLTNANNLALFMVNNEVGATASGLILSDGSNTSCGGDCHQFKGPAFRYLSLLYAAGSHAPRYYAVLKGSADSIWNFARDTNQNLFSVSWGGPSQAVVDEGQDNAACSALSRFAELYGGYPGSGIPLNQYEAENAVLHHVQLEALHSGFAGWAYITGWNADNQWVQFDVNCAASGAHTLLLRYAAGAGDAFRAIGVNGNVLFPRQSFPGTSGWGNYQTLSLACNLPAGHSTVSLQYDSSRNSSNSLNVDNLVVAGDPPEQIRILGTELSQTGSVQLTWSAIPGQKYRVQYSAGLTNGNWNDLGIPVTAPNVTANATDASPASHERYYRIVAP